MANIYRKRRTSRMGVAPGLVFAAIGIVVVVAAALVLTNMVFGILYGGTPVPLVVAKSFDSSGNIITVIIQNLGTQPLPIRQVALVNEFGSAVSGCQFDYYVLNEVITDISNANPWTLSPHLSLRPGDKLIVISASHPDCRLVKLARVWLGAELGYSVITVPVT